MSNHATLKAVLAKSVGNYSISPTNRWFLFSFLSGHWMSCSTENGHQLLKMLLIFKSKPRQSWKTWIISPKTSLVGGFNASEKYARQIGNLPHMRGKINKYVTPPPRSRLKVQNLNLYSTTNLFNPWKSLGPLYRGWSTYTPLPFQK